jgi:hypothetical protein
MFLVLERRFLSDKIFVYDKEKQKNKSIDDRFSTCRYYKQENWNNQLRQQIQFLFHHNHERIVVQRSQALVENLYW